nr:MAG TPA: hypothetical protein [Caudoviricetes sp.]
MKPHQNLFFYTWKLFACGGTVFLNIICTQLHM